MEPITVSTDIKAPKEKVWEYWTKPEHITKWTFASDDWHAPKAENDLSVGGKFKTRMEAKDQSAGFDFGGTYSAVEPEKLIEYSMDDGRKVRVEFSETPDGTTVTETFDPENENPIEMQRGGWQSILDNFKKYTEKN